MPTPAIVGPIEFTVRKDDYEALGGHMDAIRDLAEIGGERARVTGWRADNPWPFDLAAGNGNTKGGGGR